jgi:hypothetical protein
VETTFLAHLDISLTSLAGPAGPSVNLVRRELPRVWASPPIIIGTWRKAPDTFYTPPDAPGEADRRREDVGIAIINTRLIADGI